jgi:hypothetical protein
MSLGKKSDAPTTVVMVEKYILGFAETKTCPDAIKPHLIKAAPFVAKGVEFIEKLYYIFYDLYEKGMEYYEKLRPYKPDLLLPGLVGLVMCFFGGTFLTLIAAFEAFRMCGYDSTMKCVRELLDDFEKVRAANAKDDARDEDGNGVKDVVEVSPSELLKRKTLLFLRTIDPNRLALAIAGINAGFLAVIATLKMHFARTITLGNAIGAALEPSADKYIVPILEKVFPSEYRKWAKPLVQYSIHCAAISVAWTIQRFISAFHSALRGGLLFSRNILEYVNVMKIYRIDHENTYIDEVVGMGVALLGLLFQLSRGFSLPFPLSILLFPFTMMEYLLIAAVNRL